MPRRNVLCLLLMTVVSLACYGQAQRNRYGRSLGNVLDEIARRYYEPVDDSKLFQGAVEGMVNGLGDEYSQYITPEEKEAFEALINKRFEGVGMEVALDPQTKQLTVRTPLVGSPAFEAGVRAGDRILKVDGRSTQGMSLRDAIDRLHGEPGTSVTISVLHEGDKRAVELEMVRRTIVVDTVRGDTRNADGSWNFFLPGHDRIGYVRILSFSEKTADDLRQALDGLTAKRMRGLVLDLRDNPGGLLPSAVNVCDMFLPGGLIVSTRGRDKQILEVQRASGRGPFTGFPMAVLIDQDQRQRQRDRGRLPAGQPSRGDCRPSQLWQRDGAGIDRPGRPPRRPEVDRRQLLASQRREHPSPARRPARARPGASCPIAATRSTWRGKSSRNWSAGGWIATSIAPGAVRTRRLLPTRNLRLRPWSIGSWPRPSPMSRARPTRRRPSGRRLARLDGVTGATGRVPRLCQPCADGRCSNGRTVAAAGFPSGTLPL